MRGSRYFPAILMLSGIVSVLAFMGCLNSDSESSEHSAGAESSEHTGASESGERSGDSESSEHSGGSESGGGGHYQCHSAPGQG